MEPDEDTLMMDMQPRAVATASPMEMQASLASAFSVLGNSVIHTEDTTHQSATPTCIYMMPEVHEDSRHRMALCEISKQGMEEKDGHTPASAPSCSSTSCAKPLQPYLLAATSLAKKRALRGAAGQRCPREDRGMLR